MSLLRAAVALLNSVWYTWTLSSQYYFATDRSTALWLILLLTLFWFFIQKTLPLRLIMYYCVQWPEWLCEIQPFQRLQEICRTSITNCRATLTGASERSHSSVNCSEAFISYQVYDMRDFTSISPNSVMNHFGTMYLRLLTVSNSGNTEKQTQWFPLLFHGDGGDAY